jgi:3-methyladenine DNA glycosylase AlkD
MNKARLLYEEIHEALLTLAQPERVPLLAKFFQTLEGGYGYPDQFLGLTVPNTRLIAKAYTKTLDENTLSILIVSPFHEERLLALYVLGAQLKKASATQQDQLVKFYLEHTSYYNNWDLVDASAPYILGEYIRQQPSKSSLLYELAQSPLLWDQRIAVVANWMLIRHHTFEHILALAPQFLNHSHHLMHKAVGWMLREMGKRDELLLKQTLDLYASQMPRTMLRYSIEKLTPQERQYYMALK